MIQIPSRSLPIQDVHQAQGSRRPNFDDTQRRAGTEMGKTHLSTVRAASLRLIPPLGLLGTTRPAPQHCSAIVRSLPPDEAARQRATRTRTSIHHVREQHHTSGKYIGVALSRVTKLHPIRTRGTPRGASGVRLLPWPTASSPMTTPAACLSAPNMRPEMAMALLTRWDATIMPRPSTTENRLARIL